MSKIRGVCLAGLLLTCGLAILKADSASGTLYYTTFASQQTLDKVNYSWDGTTFSLTGNSLIKNLGAAGDGADGLLFAPDGNIIVAGQGNNLTEVTTGGTIVKNVAPGNPAFHMALNSNSNAALLYSMWNGGGNAQIAATQLSGGGLLNNGVAYTVNGCAGCSTDVRGIILDTQNNTWYYGTAPDGGTGDFGTLVFDDELHTATLTRLKTGVAAHGLTFDPFTNNIIFSSAGEIDQVDAAGNLLSKVLGSGNFDQSAVDGQGHLFVASNGGGLEFVDYDKSGLIGDATSFSTEQFLAGSLDDIAPIAGIGGGGQVPEPSSILFLVLALAGLGYRLRSRAA